MTKTITAPANPQAATLKATWSLVRPFWTSPHKFLHFGLFAALVAITLSSTYVAVAATRWYGGFTDMLVRYDSARLTPTFIQFGRILAMQIAAGIAASFLTSALSIRWRTWLTKYFLTRWLHGEAFFRIEQEHLVDNPDQRITEDVEQLVTLSISLALGLIGTVASLVTFSSMIWSKSGTIDFTWFGVALHIPGYMLWVAIGYAMVTATIVQFAGRRLQKLNFLKQQAEANFRFMMTGVREYAEQIALLNGGKTEAARMRQGFEGVRHNFWRITFFNLRFDPLNTAILLVSAIVPMVILLPRYFSHSVTMGEMTQMTASFERVSSGLQWFVINYMTVLQFRVVIARLAGLDAAVEPRGRPAGPGYAMLPSGCIDVKALELETPEGRRLLSDLNFSVHPGERWLIRGNSGVGKSTLLRALAGIWHFGAGDVVVPDKAKLLFLPQKNYIPPGSLKAALCYPGQVAAFDDAACRRALADCQLEPYCDSLDLVAPWGHRMSPGEQQRLGFARALLQAPDYLLLDESTSALDEDNEQQMYQMIIRRFPRIGIVSISHHRSVESFHTHTLNVGHGQVWHVEHASIA
jgi:vitamin B12/bleomycin/antimicrobial peptide transport system ATP-binding/permease protein